VGLEGDVTVVVMWIWQGEAARTKMNRRWPDRVAVGR
jgi:hypothetical protein